MYITFALFFISLAGIMTMIGRKLAPVRNGQVAELPHAHVFVPDLEKMRRFTIASIKKYEHLILVATLRSYVRFSNLTKQNYQEIRAKIKDIRKSRNGNVDDVGVAQDPNKFLKIITEYKHRVRHIKNKITEEEEKK